MTKQDADRFAKAATVSVVLPTIGRPSLRKAVESVLKQTHDAHQIVIVNASQVELSSLVPFDPRIEIVALGAAGPARARNEGFKVSRGQWVALLDDDDEWDAPYLEKQLEFAEANSLDVVLSGARYVGSSAARDRPTSPIDAADSVLQAFYGKVRWRSSPFAVPTSCILVRSDVVRRVAFDEDLRVREDIWWLYQMQLSGAALRQQVEPLCTIRTSAGRSGARESLKSMTQWAQLMQSIDPRLCRGFSWGIGLRTALISGRWRLAFTAIRLGIKCSH